MTDPITPREDTTPRPATMPIEHTGGTRLRASKTARVGLIVVCLVVLVASAAVASGASPAPSPDGASAAPAASAAPGKTGPSWGGQGGGFGQGGFSGGGRVAGGPDIGRAITIAKIDGSNVSLKTDDGWTRTITVTGQTEIRIGTQKGSLSDLKVGDEVNLRETKNSDGTYAVTLIVVRVPTVAGTITDITTGGFTIKQRNGSTKTVTVSSSTDYLIAGSTGAKSDLSVGTQVQAEGTAGSGATFAARVVHIVPDVRSGTVTATTSTTITIKSRDGSTPTIHVDAKTTYRVAGTASATIAAVKVGMVIMAQGTSRSDGSLDALSVSAGQFKMHGKVLPDTVQPSPPST